MVRGSVIAAVVVVVEDDSGTLGNPTTMALYAPPTIISVAVDCKNRIRLCSHLNTANRSRESDKAHNKAESIVVVVVVVALVIWFV